jgi:prefoldin beta subunit
MKEISPQMQNQIAQYQQLQQQLQVLASQRMQLEAKAREIDGSLQELAKTGPDTVVYKSIGALLVRADDRESIKKELDEHKETISIRVRAIQKQETSLGERFEQLQQKLSEALGGEREGESKES